MIHINTTPKFVYNWDLEAEVATAMNFLADASSNPDARRARTQKEMAVESLEMVQKTTRALIRQLNEELGK